MQTTNELTSSAESPSSKSQTVSALCKLLHTGDEADRCYASRALGVLGDPAATPELIKYLHDEDVDVCVDAAGALGKMKAVSAISELIEAVNKDPDGEVKVSAVEALGLINHESAIDTLMSIAASRPENIGHTSDSWDPWWDMQLKAVSALGLMHVEKAAPVIEKLLDDEDGQDIESELLKALAFMGEPGEEILIKRLKKGTSRERRRIIRALGHRLAHCHTPETLRILKRAIKEPDAEVRCAALEALMSYGRAEQLPEMIACFHDKDANVRKAATLAVTKLGAISTNNNPADIPVNELIALLDDNDPSVRATVLYILSDNIQPGSGIQLDDSQLEKIYDSMTAEEETSDVIAAACQLTGKACNINARQALLTFIENTDLPVNIRSTATQALGGLKLWDENIAATLTHACVDQQQAVRLAALNALLELESVSKNIASKTDDTEQKKQSLSNENLPADKTNIPSAIDSILFVYKGEILPDDEPDKETQTTAEKTAPSNNGDAKNSTIETAENAEANDMQNSPSVAATEPDDSVSSNKKVTSTIEAITRSNVQIALSTPTDATNTIEKDLSMVDDESLAPYLALVKENAEVGHWLKTRDTDATALDDARRLAIRILGKTDDPQIISLLIGALDDKDTVVRCDAANSLSEIYLRKPHMDHLSTIIKALKPLLGSSERNERIVGLQSLDLMAKAVSDNNIIDHIKTLMDDKDSAVCIQAIASLSKIVSHTNDNSCGITTSDNNAASAKNHATTMLETIERFSQLLDNTDSGIRIAAATGLTPLINILHSDTHNNNSQPLAVDTVRKIAHAGLSNRGDQARILGRVLKNTLPEAATSTLLSELTRLETSRERRFIIEMLEEIFSSDTLKGSSINS